MSYRDAEIIAIGSELLTPAKIDTNSLWLTEQLNALGVELIRKSIVGDDRARLVDAVKDALAHVDVLLITGGLGPTEDDVTRDAVAAATGRALGFRQELCDAIADRFRRMQRPMAEINKRQAFLIDGAEALPNPRGTAPGQWLEHEGRMIALLPGPPGEMKAMWTAEVLPRLEAKLPKQVIRTRFYRAAGIGESDLDAIIAPAYTQYTNPVTTILAGPSDIQIHLRARSADADEAERALADLGSRIEALLGDRIYCSDGAPLEQAVGRLLQGRTVATAESVTGGLVGERLTNVAGASAYYLGGAVTYTDAIKRSVLGVPEQLLQEHGAVSEPVARAMAEAARARFGAEYAISTTGYAGPDGERVGDVFIGIATPSGTTVTPRHFHGDRHRIRVMTAQWALDLLRRALLRDR